jgi:hypothetical protein
MNDPQRRLNTQQPTRNFQFPSNVNDNDNDKQHNAPEAKL